MTYRAIHTACRAEAGRPASARKRRTGAAGSPALRWPAFALFFIAELPCGARPARRQPERRRAGRARSKFSSGCDYIDLPRSAPRSSSLIVLLIVFIVGWRRNPGSPVMLMFLCTTLIVWQDPIMNWSPFAVYNPDLIHWPESWPLVSLSPTVEPFVVFGYVMFYFGPYFPAIWILRKLQAKYGPDSVRVAAPADQPGCCWSW